MAIKNLESQAATKYRFREKGFQNKHEQRAQLREQTNRILLFNQDNMAFQI